MTLNIVIGQPETSDGSRRRMVWLRTLNEPVREWAGILTVDDKTKQELRDATAKMVSDMAVAAIA